MIDYKNFMNALQDIGEVANHEYFQEGKEKNVCFIFFIDCLCGHWLPLVFLKFMVVRIITL